MGDPGLRIEERDGGVLFFVRVAPRAARETIVGVHDGALKVRLTAPPVEGAANRALCALLARRLRVAKSAVAVVAGERSRYKTVRVKGAAAESVQALCEAR
jgi:hypothetical protein